LAKPMEERMFKDLFSLQGRVALVTGDRAASAG
jgi:hypothetical protein